MSDIIPVIVHHETGEKPQTGGKKNQEYLRYCIAQAKKYNEKVVLLGDQYNKDWCDDWHDANDFITDKWKEFHSVFKNLSPYPQAWAEGIFRRFFLILEYLDRYGYDNCVIMDSDILLYTNVSTYEPFRHCKMAAESPLEQDIAVLWKGNRLQMESLRRCCLFYQAGTDRIHGLLYRYVQEPHGCPDGKMEYPPEIPDLRRCCRNVTALSVGKDSS